MSDKFLSLDYCVVFFDFYEMVSYLINLTAVFWRLCSFSMAILFFYWIIMGFADCDFDEGSAILFIIWYYISDIIMRS